MIVLDRPYTAVESIRTTEGGCHCIIFIIAFAYGGYAGVLPVITSDYFGLKYLGSNYGTIMIGFAISALSFPMIIGLIPSESMRYLALAVLSAIGVALVVLLRFSRGRWLSDVGRG